MRRLLFAGLMLLCCTSGLAQSPTIVEIAFEGNEVTQPRTMLREMTVKVGDAANPEAIERSRQAVLDLGLFQQAGARTEPAPGGVRLIVTVREKWYILPIPRIEADSDEDFGYGAQLRWSNLWGLNHSLRVVGIYRTYEEEDRDSATSFMLRYGIPFVGDSRNSLSFNAQHTEQSSIERETRLPYNETFNSAGVFTSRHLGSGPPSQGWRVGGGLLWQDQDVDRPDAPAAFGTAVGPSASLSYRDVRFHVFSEDGFSAGLGVSGAVDGLASDYEFWSYSAAMRRQWAVGEKDHQTLGLIAEIVGYHAGPSSRDPEAASLGGSSRVRGYEQEFQEGDFSWYLGAEFLRPLGPKWLRGLAVLEVGSAYEDLKRTQGRPVLVSAGLGLRVRFTLFVNVELEMGLAWPLTETRDGMQFFAGGV